MKILDMLMFFINPMYDYGQGDFAIGNANERQNLYRRCEKEHRRSVFSAVIATSAVLSKYISRNAWFPIWMFM